MWHLAERLPQGKSSVLHRFPHQAEEQGNIGGISSLLPRPFYSLANRIITQQVLQILYWGWCLTACVGDKSSCSPLLNNFIFFVRIYKIVRHECHCFFQFIFKKIFHLLYLNFKGGEQDCHLHQIQQRTNRLKNSRQSEHRHTSHGITSKTRSY